MKQLYELLESFGLTPRGHLERLEAWSECQTIDFLVEVCSLMINLHDKTNEPYSFIANGPMGGDPSICSDPRCRLAKLDETARFASLYANRVLILDPFEQFIGVEEITFRTLQELSFTIILLDVIRPAVEAGLIGFATGTHCFCEEHYVEYAEKAHELQIAGEVLRDQFVKNMSVEFRPSTAVKDSWEFCISAPEYMLEHGQMFLITPEIPKVFAKRLGGTKEIKLSKQEIIDSGILEMLVTPIVYDLQLQSLYGTQGFHYLTNRELDFSVVAAVNQPETEAMSSVIMSGLAHTVPTLPEASLESLTTLRTNEGEAFMVYRNKLQEVIRSLSEEVNVSSERVRQAFNDAIEPEIIRIENTIRNNKKLLVGKLRQDIVFGTGMITIGLYSGLFSPAIGEIFAGLGGFKFASEILSNANELCKEPHEIRNSSFYYLWKAKQISNS